MKNYIAYYRVSTQKQGASGLGLEAQKETVKSFISKDDEILNEYIEMESGKKDSRAELQKAIKEANEKNATLIIAKLDRLARNVSFIFKLRDSKVDFVCCDLPDANTLTIGIFATIAQHERELISERTRKALAVKKAQGYKLGKPENLTNEARQKGNQARIKNALDNERNRKAFALIKHMRSSGYSYKKIAEELNSSGFTTRYGKNFHPMGVKRIYYRYNNSD